jgi:ZIP family zinc transporter
VAAAFGWGTLAASSLVVGAAVALLFRISLRAIGLIMGFGAGVLISAVSFDLVEEAVDTQDARWPVLVGNLRRLRRLLRWRLADRPLRRGGAQGRGR